ncbi:MAG: hypothetical protein KA146_12350 [Leptospiraceae bacterium]|nr:hypothetical protein [Leptospiraceae bacterium]
MSHEIRTPLNAIVGFSTILQEKTEGNKLFTEYLGNIVQSSKVLLNLINDILDLSMVEAGRMVVSHNPVNMKSLIDEILSVFAIKASEKGIRLEPLSIETKIELLQKYLPTVHRFQENINFDNLIAFEKDLEKFSIKHDIAKLKEYCSELRDCIETFNTENIYTVLNEIEIFIKKEEKWKL